MKKTVMTHCAVERSGVYVCGDCGTNQAILRMGDDAPFCDDCKWPVTWLYHHPLGPRPIGFIIQS